MNDYFLRNQERIVPDTDWMVVFALFTVALYVLSRLLFPRYHERLSYSFFNRYEAAKLMEERNTLFSRPGLLLNIVPVLCLAISIYMQVSLLREINLYDRPLLRFLAILGLVFFYCILRILLVFLFGLSMQNKEIALRFNQVWIFNFQTLSRVLLIPVVALPFLAGILKFILLIIIWLTLASWLVYTIFRELELLKSRRISLFYMILYLCTLEILPLWWAIKSITEGW